MTPPTDLRSWDTAPATRSTWITMWSKDKHGNIDPQAVHFAQDLSGEEQPPFKGWFRSTGYGHAEVDTSNAIGWTPLEDEKRDPNDGYYLIWSEEHGAWWKPARWGYTTSIREAGRYLQSAAEEIVRSANFGGTFHEIAIPCPKGIPS